MDEIGGGFIIDSDDFGTMKDGKLTVSYKQLWSTFDYIHF